MISITITDGDKLSARLEWGGPDSGPVTFSKSNLEPRHEKDVELALRRSVLTDTQHREDVLDGEPVRLSTNTVEGFELALSELYGRTGFLVKWRTAKGLRKSPAS